MLNRAAPDEYTGVQNFLAGRYIALANGNDDTARHTARTPRFVPTGSAEPRGGRGPRPGWFFMAGGRWNRADFAIHQVW